ncbi:GumC family protein [Agrobacterium sp. AGB01]|uniref:GumC family protein n=1 Tax=Agrobacterium sp. AGB01 TaxID=2769302 RepID=UPI001781EE56|nr:GumC family protein [Agrobacterium sp. AGB01]MBD9387265.1 GumC family protein [Agrobacterium sp. AGB01]
MYKLGKAKDKQAHSPMDDAPRPQGSLLDAYLNAESEKPPYTESERPAPKPDPQQPYLIRPQQSAFTGYFPGINFIDRIGIGDILSWLRDGIIWIILAIIACVGAALAYSAMTPQRYTAYTDIIVNPSNLNVINDGVFSVSPQRDTQILEVESKLRTLTSRNVLSQVVSELKLDKDPEFINPTPIERFKMLLSRPPEEGDNSIGALRALGDRVVAERDPRSFVVTVAVWSANPEKSVTLSNAIINAFENELFQTTSEGSRRVADDLNTRLEELRVNVTEAEKKVEEFKRQNGLQVNNGELVSNQLSGELNAQVLSAQQRLIQEESRLKQMEQAISQQRVASSAIFDSETMNTIREQYSILQQQIGAMTMTYGSRHPRLATANAEKAMLEQGFAQEAQRILETVKTSVAESRSSLDALRQKAVAERANVFTDNDAQVKLRDLERDARTVAAIYETYLTRSRQIAEQQAINSTNVRVISRAVAPNFRSWPPGKMTLMILGGFAGLFLGIGLALTFGAWRYLRGSYGFAPAAATRA